MSITKPDVVTTQDLTEEDRDHKWLFILVRDDMNSMNKELVEDDVHSLHVERNRVIVVEDNMDS